MSDYTVVYFAGIDRGFSVPSVLADFSILGVDIQIRFYGAIIAFGFLLAVLFGGRMAYKWKMSLDKMVDVLIYGTVAAIIGARLYYVFSKWDYYGNHLSEIPKIWNGGLAIYGGLIAGVLAAYFVCKARKMNFWNLLDIATMSFLIGQGIGRWGNFTNQEAFGTNTDLPWGMWSEKVADYIINNQAFFAANGFEVDPMKYVHPTFLYESIWCLLGFFVLYLICRKGRKFSGQIALCYGIWYGAERMVVEGLRTDSLYIAGTTIRASQALSAVLVIFCAVMLIVLLRKYTKNPKPIDGVDYFTELDIKAREGDIAKTEKWVEEWTKKEQEAAAESKSM
ncbi:MAG: prolipoprotein diacylglyceryl transferase [Clostridiaceae bacterium]|nr:prolipoprotein diacylglyceryl transferase [Clostridiaceae bacterium]